MDLLLSGLPDILIIERWPELILCLLPYINCLKLELKDTVKDHRIDAQKLSEYLNQHCQREGMIFRGYSLQRFQRIHLYNVTHFVSTPD